MTMIDAHHHFWNPARIPQPWMTMADVFGSQGRELHSRITEQVFSLWVIDKEDF